MTDAPLSIAGKLARTGALYVAWRGVWMADLELPGDEVPGGRVEVRMGPLTLSGTVDPDRSGVYRSGARVRVVGGAGGWEKPAPRRHFHADQGLRRKTVLEDTARAVGESLSFESGDGDIGVDFVRLDEDEGGFAQPASAVFAQLAVPLWWVAYDGTTHVAIARPAPVVGDIQVLDFDPRLGTVLLSDIAPIEVGSVLTLDGTDHVVRELRVEVGEKKARTTAIVSDVVANRLYDSIAAIVRQIGAERLHGLFEFRVLDMVEDRARLQRASRRASPGLPDVLLVSQWPGIAGTWAKLAEGALVLLEFAEGDPTKPRITHAERKEGAGFVPVELLLDASETLRLGPSTTTIQIAGPDGKAVHRVDDFGEAGTLSGSGALSYSGPNGGSGSITATADLSTGTVTFSGSISLTTKATTGSEKVTSE